MKTKQTKKKSAGADPFTAGKHAAYNEVAALIAHLNDELVRCQSELASTKVDNERLREALDKLKTGMASSVA